MDASNRLVKKESRIMTTERTIKVPIDVQSHKGYKKWLSFHLANREVMRSIVAELAKAKEARVTRTSVKMIINVIRWNLTLSNPDKPYKINDRYTGIYTHIIAHNFPEYRSMIETRELRAVKKI